MSLQGKTALVTGGARGIGFDTVERLLKDGARCVIWDCDQAAIDEAKAKLDGLGEITSDTVELAKPDSVDAAAGQRLGGSHIDILVNNAGIAGVNKMLWECTPEEWRDVMDIDLYVCSSAAARLCRACSRPAGAHRERGLDCRQGESHGFALQRGQGRSHRVDQVARQRVVRHKRAGELYHAGGDRDGNPQAVHAGAHRLQLSKIPMGRVGQAAEMPR